MGKWISTFDYGLNDPPPTISGCYAIYFSRLLTEHKKLVYIGTAYNLQERLNKHPIEPRSIGIIRTVKIRPMINEDRFLLEKKLISKLNPTLNKQHRTS